MDRKVKIREINVKTQVRPIVSFLACSKYWHGQSLLKQGDEETFAKRKLEERRFGN